MQLLFRDEVLLENFLYQDRDANRFELDVWLPHSKIAFEYQGEQHYHNLEQIFGKTNRLSSYIARDQRKMTVLKEEISLVTVPCWWDGSLDSLKSILSESDISV